MERREQKKVLNLASQNREYVLRGAALEIQSCADPEIAIEGAAGTGKSLAVLYKLHRLAQQYRGARLLICRQTRESLTESALVTFERDILGEGHPLTFGAYRPSRHSYRYTMTGSEIIIAGMRQAGKDQRAKIMSTDFDLIYVQEAPEILEMDYEKLTTRLRNNKMPYQQIILDLNPDVPLHWIYRRETSKKLRLFHSYHKDNPSLWNGTDWTPEGKIYLERLSRLTGVQRARFFEGKRAMAEGLIYGDVWDDGAVDGNVTELAEYVPDENLQVLWGVDDGYAGAIDETGYYTAESHPRAFLLAQIHNDGTICIFNESYAIKKLSNVHVKQVLELPYSKPVGAAVDKSAAELRGMLHSSEFGIYTRETPSKVDESIKVLRRFLAKDENGKRRVLVHPRCRNLRMEMSMYRYEVGTETPIKQFDHGCDALRYLVWGFRNS